MKYDDDLFTPYDKCSDTEDKPSNNFWHYVNGALILFIIISIIIVMVQAFSKAN